MMTIDYNESHGTFHDDKKMKLKVKFILVVTDVTDSDERTKYFGPFDDGEQALNWGQEHFDSVDYFLMSTTLYTPSEKNND